ncbi:MAG: purine-binding chemotaxis protein CheW [Deltaproteobacteria bacterium]|nr:purine-binding chemotaxis protein CheW [Deltaproteobacteria bacterium]
MSMNDVSSNQENQTELGGRYLCFTLGKEKFAIPLLQVKEVLGTVETTAIPQAPPHFKGIMNLRGQVISVIDLRLKLKLGKPEAHSETTFIILDFAPLSLGVIVDSVDSVVAIEGKDISRTPDVESNVKTEFIQGVARSEKALTLILDLKLALNADDYKILKEQNNKAA